MRPWYSNRIVGSVSIFAAPARVGSRSGSMYSVVSLRRLILILLQPILVDVLAIVALEDGDLHRLLELLQDLDGLIGQAVDLVRGEIPALVLARAEVVDRDEDPRNTTMLTIDTVPYLAPRPL